MTRLVLRLCEQIVGQPTHHRILVEAPFGLQQLHTLKQSAKLILPATTRGEHLLKHQRAVSYLVLIPAQSAEVV